MIVAELNLGLSLVVVSCDSFSATVVLHTCWGQSSNQFVKGRVVRFLTQGGALLLLIFCHLLSTIIHVLFPILFK